tara:strand:+ start:202 stop:1206 length:1005 start_codon:yes stop_codon:yes gene_type:complete
MKNKTILITGAAGYIGGTFAYEAVKRGYKVIGIDNFSNSTKRNIQFIKNAFPNNFTFYEIDILSSELIKIFKKHSAIDCVFHFAALKSVPESEKKPNHYFKNNVEGTQSLIKIMQSQNIKKLIFSSSAAVYGEHKIQPMDEKTDLNPKSIYAKTKKLSEEHIEKATEHNNLKAVSLRYFNPVGSHEEKCIGEDFQISENVMAKIVKVVLGLQNELYVYGNDYETEDGTGERDYIHIDDIVEGHFKALHKIDSLEDYSVFNLGTGSATSVLKLIKTFEIINNVEINYQITERRQGDLARCFANPFKANTELNWHARYNLERMCKDTWEIIKNEPN